jgi:hypothetical protein
LFSSIKLSADGEIEVFSVPALAMAEKRKNPLLESNST